MIKSKLISTISVQQPHLPDTDIAFCINEIVEEMSKALSQGERIEIRGFGSFELHYRESRVGHNPKTGEPLQTKPRHRPHFKPGKELRDRVNSTPIES